MLEYRPPKDDRGVVVWADNDNNAAGSTAEESSKLVSLYAWARLARLGSMGSIGSRAGMRCLNSWAQGNGLIKASQHTCDLDDSIVSNVANPGAKQ